MAPKHFDAGFAREEIGQLTADMRKAKAIIPVKYYNIMKNDQLTLIHHLAVALASEQGECVTNELLDELKAQAEEDADILGFRESATTPLTVPAQMKNNLGVGCGTLGLSPDK